MISSQSAKRKLGGANATIGAQVQCPLALVVVGGILLTPILVLIILPVLIDVFSRRTRPDVVDQRAIEPV